MCHSCSVTNDDNDAAGVIVSPTVGTTTEDVGGAPATFTFTLTSQPTDEVRIPINLYDPTETSGPNQVVIQPADWNTGVTIEITGIDDAIVDGDVVDEINTGNPQSDDPAYDALNGGNVAQITVTNQDDDVAGVNVTPTSGTTTEIEGAATFTFTLASEPLGDVTIPLNQYDTSEGTGPSSVTLNSTNWENGVVVTVTGVNDTVDDGDISYTLVTGNVTSASDPAYDALDGGDVPNLLITNEDNDQAILTFLMLLWMKMGEI